MADHHLEARWWSGRGLVDHRTGGIRSKIGEHCIGVLNNATGAVGAFHHGVVGDIAPIGCNPHPELNNWLFRQERWFPQAERGIHQPPLPVYGIALQHPVQYRR